MASTTASVVLATDRLASIPNSASIHLLLHHHRSPLLLISPMFALLLDFRLHSPEFKLIHVAIFVHAILKFEVLSTGERIRFRVPGQLLEEVRGGVLLLGEQLGRVEDVEVIGLNSLNELISRDQALLEPKIVPIDLPYLQLHLAVVRNQVPPQVGLVRPEAAANGAHTVL